MGEKKPAESNHRAFPAEEISPGFAASSWGRALRRSRMGDEFGIAPHRTEFALLASGEREALEDGQASRVVVADVYDIAGELVPELAVNRVHNASVFIR